MSNLKSKSNKVILGITRDIKNEPMKPASKKRPPFTPEEGEKFARKCDVTGEGMDEGYVVGYEGHATMYIKYKADLIEHIKWHTKYGTIHQAYRDDYYYWTGWHGHSDEEWQIIDGVMTDINKVEKIPAYHVHSPDGFSIEYEGSYTSEEEREKAFIKWMERFKQQGYYSYRGERIPLDELRSRCKFTHTFTTIIKE